jgi:hypothetical protein
MSGDEKFYDPEKNFQDWIFEKPSLREFIDEFAEGAVVFDGCDEAIVGYASRINLEPVVVYSYQLLVGAFIKQGMTEDEAIDWVDYNIVGSWVGERTPLILYTP